MVHTQVLFLQGDLKKTITPRKKKALILEHHGRQHRGFHLYKVKEDLRSWLDLKVSLDALFFPGRDGCSAPQFSFS